MQVWSRDPITSRLTRSISPPKSDPIMAQISSLQDRFYPIRTFFPPCIRLPDASGNNFELKPQFSKTLSKFHYLKSKYAYFFIREFEEVCLMMRIPQLGYDVIRLHFISFSLKDLANKWLYSLAIDSVTS